MTLDDIVARLDIGEDQDVEFKLAEGGLSKALWETISAFANTEGGHIVLGVCQKDGRYEIVGIKSAESQRKAFWDGHNNPQKLSTQICAENDVRVIEADGRRLLLIHVPRAERRQRPVFINGNPITGTFKRNYEGDYRCTEGEVRQMLRDASEEPQDGGILDGFTIADLDPESMSAYRNRFASREPDHPFLGLDDAELMRRLGGWGRDRSSGREGITLAGLLMFGRERGLLDALPHYHLDYQERLSTDPEQRWTFRITLDGKWEGNLFNFYFRVYPRLVADLDLPFKLDAEAVRVGETHVHEALREALVNTLIHADHQSSRPLTVVKTKTDFIFTNPGRLRIPRDVLYQGGVSDPRNPSLQRMFQMLGLGEKAGSGFQKILRAWREQQWLMPIVLEHPRLEMTRMILPVASLMPDEVAKELRAVVGEKFAALDELDRVILMIAHRFGEIGNADIQPYRAEHPREIGDRLKALVERKCLEKSGHGRGTRYRLPGAARQGVLAMGLVGDGEPGESEQSPKRSEQFAAGSEHLARLSEIAAPVREKGKADKGLVRETLLALCTEDFLSLRTLAELLNRSPDSIRNHYLAPMLSEGLLELRFPTSPNHPNQGYRTKKPAAAA